MSPRLGLQKSPDADRGQALTELLLVLGLTLGPALITGALFHAEWSRLRCAYSVFEHTHAALVGARASPTWNELVGESELRLTEGPDSIRGEARCGDVRERVTLPRLEAARWSEGSR